MGRPLPGLVSYLPPPFVSNRQAGLPDTTNDSTATTLGDNPQGGTVFCPREAFNLHGLVAGSSGTGKTTLTQSILSSLLKQSIVPLAIEPAKREYRAMRHLPGFQDLLVLGPGDRHSPLHIDPFALPVGARVSEHISLLMACFMAAFPSMDGPLGIILEQGIRLSYSKVGWADSDVAGSNSRRPLPTLDGVVGCVTEIIDSDEHGGYRGEIRSNLNAALRVRLLNLSRSLVGDVFGSPEEVVESTSLKIALPQAGAADRATMGEAIGLTQPQVYYFERLPKHHAVVHVVSWTHPLLCQFKDMVGRSELQRKEAEANVRLYPIDTFGPTPHASPTRTYGGTFAAGRAPTRDAPDKLVCACCNHPPCRYLGDAHQILRPTTVDWLMNERWAVIEEAAEQLGDPPLKDQAEDLIRLVQDAFPLATPKRVVKIVVCAYAQLYTRTHRPIPGGKWGSVVDSLVAYAQELLAKPVKPDGKGA